jgi:hypothetical protein
MKICTLLLVSLFLFQLPCFAQHVYLASGGEMIFSYGKVTGNDSLTGIVRWTPFFNYGAQVHVDFSKNFGIYSGLNIRNIGLISHYNNGEVKIKERSYELGLPLALKVGNMDGVKLDVGAEADLMFAYKRKIEIGSNKTKFSQWFSSNVNIFNPSLFGEISLRGGEFLRFQYYLDDFLNYTNLELPSSTIPPIVGYGKTSKLFFISIGKMFKDVDIKNGPDSNAKQVKAQAKRNMDNEF